MMISFLLLLVLLSASFDQTFMLFSMGGVKNIQLEWLIVVAWLVVDSLCFWPRERGRRRRRRRRERVRIGLFLPHWLIGMVTIGFFVLNEDNIENRPVRKEFSSVVEENLFTYYSGSFYIFNRIRLINKD